MMIEQNTNYAYKLKYMDNPSFDKVRDLSTKFYRELPQALQDELFEALNRGIDILDSEPQMTAYLFAFGKMHQAKLDYAFGKLPEEFLEQPEINIIDYGCGQALGTMCYTDFLREKGYSQKVKAITLIEPSEICLKRAALHASAFFPNAEIKTVNKKFDDLTQDDIVCNEETPTLHVLSNVLDMLNFNLERFAELVKGCLKGYIQFVCVGPYFGKNDRSKRMDDFANNLMEDIIYTADLNSFELDPNYSWTCMVRCFGVGDLDYSISDKTLSTEVTDEDIENGIIDKFGVVYSKDGKRLVSAENCDCKTYTINKGIKVICDRAFFCCKSLQSIVIPNSVTSIGHSAFQDCASFQSIVIPESVTSIGDSAFSDCVSLQSIVIPNSVTSIGNSAFSYCVSLQSIVIPNSVTSIGDSAFFGCKSLQSIVIPDNVKSIGLNPFGDSGIHSIVSHSIFFKVDGKALYDQNKKMLIAFYSNDTHFVIPNSVTNIGDSAFFGCESLDSIVIPDSVTNIGDSAFFGCKSLGSIVIPNSVTNIGNRAFRGCTSLQSIVIPDSITSIGDNTFSYCLSLQSIVIPNSVTSIGDSTFYECSYLRSIVIPNSVTSIGDSAFSYCESLQSIVIPNSVTSIGDSAFFGCESLDSIVIPDSVTNIGANPFDNSVISSIVSHSIFFKVDGKALYDQNKKMLIAFYSNDTHFVIPDSVTSIGECAFFCCRSLQSIVIQDSVTSIGDNAFSYCESLQSIVIPNSVTKIGDLTFRDCHSLQSIVIPNSVTIVGNWVFSDCASLQSIVIPDSVSSIGGEAFRNCTSLKAIIIPKGSRKKFEKLLPDDIDKLVEQ